MVMKREFGNLIEIKWMNAAGTAGFAPGRDFAEKFPEISVFTTNPISYLPRSVASNRNLVPFEGGFLIHTGYPCPGFNQILKKYKKNWENSSLPICINLLSDHAYHIEKIVRMVETIENIFMIEISLRLGMNRTEIKELMNAALGELPIILSLPFDLVFMDWLDEILAPEIVAISIQAPRGQLYHKGIKINGRLFGASILPLTLNAIDHLRTMNKPVLAGVGAITHQDIEKIYQSGASVFQAHELVWRNYF